MRSHTERFGLECVWGSHTSICHTVCRSGPGTLRTGYSLLLSFGWPPGANEISTHSERQRRHDDTVVVAVWTRREKNHVKRYCHGLISTISGELIWLNRTTATQKGDDTRVVVGERMEGTDETDWNGAIWLWNSNIQFLRVRSLVVVKTVRMSKLNLYHHHRGRHINCTHWLI